VVQDALVKAVEAYPSAAPIANPEGWLFRVAHNAALDHLRRRARQATAPEEELAMIADPADATADREIAAMSLRTFMRLPVAQRSSVILMDVLGYSLAEIGDVAGMSVAAVKAALHRGRDRLRELAAEPDERPLPVLSAEQRSLLAAYVDRFNARDFDAIRDMLAGEVRLELVARTRLNGRKEVGTYLHNYAETADWHFAPGLVDGCPAVLVTRPGDPSGRPAYFILVKWDRDRVTDIRDFRYAAYAIEGADVVTPDRRP
jgi:RNA polymerase sigma-70 factor (ECF subfamily)